MGVDYQTSLADAASVLPGIPLQGNINPDFLSLPWAELAAHTDAVIADGMAAPAHVVNLGHGVPPETNPHVLTRLVAHIHEHEVEV